MLAPITRGLITCLDIGFSLTTAGPIRSATIDSDVTKMVAPPPPINTVDPYKNTSATVL